MGGAGFGAPSSVAVWFCTTAWLLLSLEPRLVGVMAVVRDLFVSSPVLVYASPSFTVLERACLPLGLFRV